MLSLVDTWIKAAVEHRVIEIEYFSKRTKRELTKREIEPDFVGLSKDRKNHGLWATFCYLRHGGPRCFKPDSIIRYSVTQRNFNPSSMGRWRELNPTYEERRLKDKQF